MKFSRILPVVVLFLVSSLSGLAAFAQGSSGGLNGTLTDSSGALVGGAALSLVNEATGVQRQTTTNATGTYVLNNINPGTYTIRATHAGFAQAERSGVVIGVNQTVTMNLALAVGAETQTVSVQANSALLEASTSELGTVIDDKVTTDLPINGREFTQLLTLTPGASRLNTSQNTSGREPAGPGAVVLPAMHGQNNRNNYFMMDGISDNEDLFSTFAVSPTVDDIQEFKVQSHNDSAQFGFVLGGVINVVTKSGTNRLHGALWEFNRNNALGAANPITGLNGQLNQNQFGGSIGGPVWIPKLYNGRDRTFFYFSYEGFRKNVNANSLKTVLTQDELNGDFSAFPVATQQIYNPFVAGRPAYTGNKIDPTTFNPIAVKAAKLLLPIAPLGSPVTNNYTDTTPTETQQNNFSVRIDESLGKHNSFWGRYSRIKQPSTSSGGYAGLVNNTTVTATNWGLDWLHIFNDSTTLNLQFGRNVDSSVATVKYTQGASADLVNQIGFSTAFACGYLQQGADTDCLVPALSVTGYTASGENISDSDPATGLWQYSGDFSKVKGRHFIQAGAYFFNNSFHQQAVGATVGFSAQGTMNSASKGGNAAASFLLGVVDNSKDRATVIPIGGQKAVGGYVQDQWKIRPNLTLNFGVRYDVGFWPRYGDPSNLTDAIGEIDFSNGTYILQRSVGDCASLGKAPCIPGGLANQSNVVVSPNGVLWDNVYDNWQPRAGFAYTPVQGTVVRGGFGVFYDVWSGMRQTVQGIGGDWPSVTQPSAQNQDPVTAIPTVNMANPLNGTTSLPAANPFTQSTYYRDPHAQNPRSFQYNFGIQQQMNSHTTLEVDYVGSKNDRLPLGGGLYNVATHANPAGTSAAVIASQRPYPNITPTRYDRSVGYGNYNGLETRLTQTQFHGLQYIISYTWSRTLDLACDGLFGVEGCSEQNPYDLRGDYGPAGYDLPNNLSVSATYELPIGRGKLVNIQNRALAQVLGGWQINGIYAMTSGQPFTITTTGDLANTGNTNEDRGNRVGNPYSGSGLQTRAKWFNTAAYVAPASGNFGTSGRNELRGQVYHDLDASIFKKVSLGEKRRLEFRLEAFNALNHLVLANPGANVSTPASFGVISGERSVERQVQVAVKFVY